MAWEASPIKATWSPSFQGLHRIITSDEVGWVFQSSVRLGSKGTTSGKCVLKNRCTLSSSVKESKPSGPSYGPNNVHVNVLSGLGKAISMK